MDMPHTKAADYLVFVHAHTVQAVHLDTGRIKHVDSFDGLAQRISPEPLEKPGWINDVAYFDGALWVAGAWTGVYSLTDGRHMKRDTSTNTLFDLNGRLIDAGFYGVRDTLTGEEILSRALMDGHGIYAIDDFFWKDGELHAVCENKSRSHSVYRLGLEEQVVEAAGPHIPTTLKHGKVVYVHGRPVSNVFDNRKNPYSSDALVSDGAFLGFDGGVIRDFVYDDARGELYVAIDNSWAKTREKKLAVIGVFALDYSPAVLAHPLPFKSSGNIVELVGGQIRAMALVSAEQLDKCRKTEYQKAD
jgi:hypothetical protein